MATRQQITDWIAERDKQFADATIDILIEINHILQAIYCFVDCKCDAITWYEIEQKQDSIVLHGVVKSGTDDEQALLDKLGTSSILVEVPDQFLDNDDPVLFVGYLLEKSREYAAQIEQLKVLAQITKTNPTVH